MADGQVLPSPNSDTLLRAPLELVVCQVRHEPYGDSVQPEQALAFHNAVSDHFPRAEATTGHEFLIDPNTGIPQVTRGGAWRFTSTDGHWVATVSPDSFALEAKSYTTWTDFHALLSEVVDAAIETSSPKLLQRVGVRCIDRIWREGSTLPSSWAGLLDPGVLGLATNPALASAVTLAQTYSEMVFQQYRAGVRGSLATDKNPSGYSMVLDTDCYDDTAKAFKKETIDEVVGDLHTLSLQLFQTVITDTLYCELHG